jgi:MFS transporter, DHA1 family, tetracycline resistance protein
MSDAERGAQPPIVEAREPSRAATYFVLVTVLLDTLGVGLIIPVAPRLVASFLGNDLSAASRYFGILFSLYSVMQFLFSPVLGGLSDRFGRRPVILTSLLGAGVSYLFSGFAPALGWLFAGRTIAGIAGASFVPAGAYIADVTPPEKRAQNFGLLGAAFGLGFIFGPALGGALGDISLRVPYFAAAGLNFVNLLYGLLVLPESLRRENRRPFSFVRANPAGALRALFRHPIVRGLTGTMFCSFMAQMILQSIWALYNQGRFGWSARQVGFSLMVAGMATAVVQGGLVRALTPRLGERRLLVAGLVMGGLSHVAFGCANRTWMMFLILLPLALGGLAGPATQAIISRAVGPKEQGELQGSINTLSTIAAIVGPLVGATLFGRFGSETATPYVPGAPFFAGAAFSALGLALALRLLARTPETPSKD